MITISGKKTYLRVKRENPIDIILFDGTTTWTSTLNPREFNSNSLLPCLYKEDKDTKYEIYGTKFTVKTDLKGGGLYILGEFNLVKENSFPMFEIEMLHKRIFDLERDHQKMEQMTSERNKLLETKKTATKEKQDIQNEMLKQFLPILDKKKAKNKELKKKIIDMEAASEKSDKNDLIALDD